MSNAPESVPESVGKPEEVKVTGPENTPVMFPPIAGVVFKVEEPDTADGVIL